MSKDATGHIRRRLAAILFASYNRLQPGDEAGSFGGLKLLQTEFIEPQVLRFGGHVITWTGDGTLIAFESAIEAVRCAVALLDAVSKVNRALLADRRFALRIGINLDDILVESDDVFGDGVNIAARLEAIAEPGSIYVSKAVHDRVRGKVDFDFVDLGSKALKNIREPVRVYRIGGVLAKHSNDLGSADAMPATNVLNFDDRRAVAVLPFANFSDDPEQEFFADGITEDIIALLAGWRAFPVIARASTFTYKRETVDIKKIGEELGVRYVLEGSVRRAGRRVRVTAQLIRTDTAHHLLAEKYDRDLTDLFELQDDITRAIAGAIEPELLKFERDRIAERPQHSGDAYDLYQRGMWHHYRHTKEDNIEAQALFRRALTTDPQYPQAFAALAIAVCNAAYLAWADNAERNYQESFELAQYAVALDGRYPNARFALALTCMYLHRSDRAVAEMRQAIELNPSFAAAHAILGHILTYAGRPDETIPLVEKAIRLSPNDPRLFIWFPALAAAHYQLGHYERAVEIGRRSWALNRNWPTGLTYVVAGLVQLGRLDEAREVLITYQELRPADLATWERRARRLFQDAASVDHILEALRKAGME